MRIFWVAALCAALGGCASATRGLNEKISVATTPSGAEVSVAGRTIPGFMTNDSGAYFCTTPCVFEVKRSDDVVVTITKEGYEPQVIPLTKEVAGTGAAGFAGNILLGGLVGMGVDAATGAALDHKPNPVIVTMQPKAAPPAPVTRHRTPRPTS